MRLPIAGCKIHKDAKLHPLADQHIVLRPNIDNCCSGRFSGLEADSGDAGFIAEAMRHTQKQR